MRGFYRMDYAGAKAGAGTGAGALAFVDGKIAGLDVGGGTYKGAYKENADGSFAGTVDLHFAQGGTLVTGAVIPPNAPPIPISFAFPADVEGQIVSLSTPTGPVNVKLTKISGL